jgi:hypothetical protein
VICGETFGFDKKIFPQNFGQTFAFFAVRLIEPARFQQGIGKELSHALPLRS